MALFLALVLPAGAAHALSSACTALNAASGSTSYTNRFYNTDFAAGETVNVSFMDNGQNAGGSSIGAELVTLKSRDLSTTFLDYRSNTGNQGMHPASVSASQLAAGGLYIRTTSGNYISAISITCAGAVSTDATLSNLTTSAGALSPAFGSGTTSYSLSVGNATTSLTVRPTATDSSTTITVNGSPVVSGADSPAINLNVGSNTLTLTATAADRTTVRTYTLNVTRAEAPPVASNVTATVAANSSNNPITLAITGNAATLAVPSNPAHGTAVVSGTSITYTPTAGYSGTDSFTYTASNGSGTSAAATVSITVSRPTLSLSPATSTLTAGQVGASYSQTLGATAGTAPYTYSATGLPSGLNLNTSTGVIGGTPTATGSFSVSVVATDAQGATGSASYTLEIADAAPLAGAVTATVSANSSNNTITLALSGGTAVSVALASVPSHGQATVTGRSITYTPIAGFSGTDSFTYTATNASGTSAPGTITVTVSALPLSISPASGTLPGGQEGTAYSQPITASGGTGPYSYSATGLPSGVSIGASSGVLSGTPTSAGVFSVAVTAMDSAGASTSANYSLEITAQPASVPVAAPVSATVTGNSASNPITLALSGGTATAVTIVAPPSHGTASVSGTRLYYTPYAGFSGTDSISYRATNTAGTSAVATITLTVTSSALTLSPAAGALPAVQQGNAYDLVFNVNGGTAPYTFSASGLPAGLNLDAASGRLSGTPTTEGNATFSVTATDAHSVQANATYTLSVTSTLPRGADTAVSVAAGQSVSVDLSAGASGGPFTAATLLDTPPQAMGTAHLNGLTLTFASTTSASGTLALRYTLTNRAGASLPATLTLQINARTSPAQDREVAGTLSAQAQSASQFAQAQISNFSNRLEQLHDLSGHRDAFNLRFGLDQARPRQDEPDDGLELFRAQTALQDPNTDQWAALHATEDKDSQAAPSRDIALWTGGYIDFGKYRKSGTKVDNRMTGISAGADYRLSPALTVGAGVGLGRDRSDIGAASKSRAESYSAAVYGSYHPGPLFLDALVGYSWLSFDSDRYVSETGRYANGSRDGEQLFGSLSSGYEAKGQNWLLSPYGRLDASSTRLRGYRESNAEAYNLEYAGQNISLFAGIVGIRGQYGIPLGWGQLNLRSRLEYSHALNADSEARVGYVDVGDFAYSVKTEGIDQNTMSAAVGADFLWASGLTTGIGYQGTRALGQDSRSDSVSMRVIYRF